jgi:hypothetical protein
MQEKIEKSTHQLVRQLREIQGVDTSGDAEGHEMYKTLKDTFNAFDRDGNAEMQYLEYVESWKFLNQPGSEADIKRAFDTPILVV